MQILILNACIKDSLRFAQFQSLLKQTISFCIKNLTFYTVRVIQAINIKSFIEKQSSPKGFNFDMVFVLADERMAPWTEKAKALLFFLLAVIRNKKFLFCAGSASQALVYLYTNQLQEQNIKTKIYLDPRHLHTLKSPLFKEACLHSETADLFQLGEDGQLHPKRNLGIRKRRILKKQSQVLGFLSKGTEGLQTVKKLVRIEKHLVNHYLLKKLPVQFQVKSHTNFTVHGFKLDDFFKNFNVLARIQDNPVLIEFNQQIIGCSFRVDRSEVSGMLMKNLIRQQSGMILQQVSKDRGGRRTSLQRAKSQLLDSSMKER